jgi:hypothetical protein
MIWPEVRHAYPNRWLIIEAVEAHAADERRILDKIAVMEACDDNAEVMPAYERWHQAYPQREFYFAHTGREELDIRERRWLGILHIFRAVVNPLSPVSQLSHYRTIGTT